MSEYSQDDKLATVGMSESDSCGMVGNIILIISIVVGVIYIFVFGKVETVRYSEYAGVLKDTVWSFAQIVMGVAIALNGLLWWYIFQKIGSILRHLEKLNK